MIVRSRRHQGSQTLHQNMPFRRYHDVRSCDSIGAYNLKTPTEPIAPPGRHHLNLNATHKRLSRRLHSRVRVRESSAQSRAAEAPAVSLGSILLNGVLENIGESVVVLDTEFRLLACNHLFDSRYFAAFGKHAEPGSTPLDVLEIRPDEYDATLKLWQRALAGECFTTIRYYTMVDLSRETLEARFSCLRDHQGTVIGAVQVARDLSLSVRAEEDHKKRAADLLEAQSLAQFGNWTFDVGTGVTTWSQQMFDLFGFDSSQGMPSFETVMTQCHPRDVRSIHLRVAVLLAGGEPLTFELQVPSADGSSRCLSARAHGEKGEDGKVDRLLGTFMDITERKAIEEAQECALRRSEELRRLFNLSTELVSISGLDGELEMINPAWSRTLGYSEQELLDVPITKFAHPDDVGAMREVGDLLAANPGIGQSFENRWRCKDGTYRWLSWNAVYVRAQDRIYGVARDVTDEKIAAEAQRGTEELLVAVIEQMPAGIIIAEAPSGRMIVSNQELNRINGTPLRRAGRVQDYQVTSLHNADNTKMAWEDYPLVRAIVHGETTHQREAIMNHADGSQIFCAINAAPVRNASGNTIAGVLVVDDITEQKLMQREFYYAQKMESVGRLAGGIAHDFNNLLSIIMGHAELVNNDLSDDSSSKASITTILRATETAADLTRRMLVFARRQATETEVVCPNTVLQSTIRMLCPLIREEILVSTEYGSDLGHVRMDANQLEQVIVNLVRNAQDAMPHGGRLTLKSTSTVLQNARCMSGVPIRPGSYVLLSVSDSGIGMDNDTKARLFEPFFTTKEAGKGTGLGLATVYGIVRQHFGYILVDTAPACGTTFTVCLPCEAGPVSAPSLKQDHRTLEHAGETVLVVEDEPLLRELSTKTLSKHGYKVLCAEDGVEAMKIAAAYPGEIHLLLTDAIMPNMGGTELAGKLRLARPSIRILLSSGYTEERLAAEVDPFADAQFLPKPFTLVGLLTKVRETLATTHAG